MNPAALPPMIAWDDGRPLVRLAQDNWTIKDACEGLCVFGGTGSGKTSGSGRAVALSFLSAGFGGLVLCAKTDEASLWQRYARETGREADLVLFGRNPELAFNFLDHEATRAGDGAGLTENLVNLFIEVASIGDGGPPGRGGGDPFWDRAMKSLVRNCVELLGLAGERISLHSMMNLIRTAPEDAARAESPEWRVGSYCWGCIEEARSRTAASPARIDCAEVESFWTRQLPSLGDRTRGSVVAMFTTLAESLMRGRMRELFCGPTTIAPESALSGRIIVVDLPVKEWSEVGRFAAVLWKYCMQKTIERRSGNERGQGRPVFIWADECQYFASRYDASFQATARSSRAAGVYMTQSYSSLAASMGGDASGRAVIDTLLGNLGTKIFHANTDRATNQLAADLIGRRLLPHRTIGGGASLGFSGSFNAGLSSNESVGEHLDYEIQPGEFSLLRKGGPENGHAVEAVVLQNGREWRFTGKPWQKIAFNQPPLAHAPAFAPSASHARRR